MIALGSLLALVSAIAYSAMYFLVRAGVRKGDPDGGAFVTTVVNATLLTASMIVVTLLGGPPKWNLGAIVWFAVSGVLGTFTGRVLSLAGLRRIGPVRTASVVNTAPVITIAVSVLVLGERLSNAAIVSAAMVLVGLVLLALDAFGAPDPTLTRAADRGPGPARAAGIAVNAFAATGSTATGSTATGSTATRRPGRGTTPAVTGLVLSVFSALNFGSARVARRLGIVIMPDPLAGSMVAALAALASQLILQASQGRIHSVVIASVHDIRPTLWLGGVASTIGLLTFFIAVSIAPLSTVSVVAASETVITMLMSWLLFRRRETLSPRVVIAAVCVFGAGVLVALS